MEPSLTHKPALITFPPSLDSELSRFLVTHYGIEHEEQPHAFIFSFFATLWHGSTLIFPLLYNEHLKLVGPEAIADYFDHRCTPELRLYPQDADEKRQVTADWTNFNQTLAFATAVFAYYHLLPHRQLMIVPLSRGAPRFEQKSVASAYPIFAGALRLLLRLTAERAQQSLAQIRTIFGQVDARLADGRTFLVGNRLTLSDLAFAVAAAPVVLPAAYGGPIPPFDQMPPEIQAAVNEMRSHAAGQYALQIYEKHRNQFGQARSAA
jgi:glutathione S-transferase